MLKVSIAMPSTGQQVVDEYNRLKSEMKNHASGTGFSVKITEAGRVSDGFATGETKTEKMFDGGRRKVNTIEISGSYSAYPYKKTARYVNREESIIADFTEKDGKITKYVVFNQTPRKQGEKHTTTRYHITVDAQTGNTLDKDSETSRY